MKKEIANQEKNPEKSLQERLKKFENGMEREMLEKNIRLEELNPAELMETFLLIYEGVKEKSLSVEEFDRLKKQINTYISWAASEVQRIQFSKEKNMQ